MAMNNNHRVTCENCGREGAHVRRIARTYGKPDQKLVIENIPQIICPHCGENYFTSQTLQRVEEIIHHRRSGSTAQGMIDEAITFS
jgi:YgiT-type zinc finger domain-containing protein